MHMRAGLVKNCQLKCLKRQAHYIVHSNSSPQRCDHLPLSLPSFSSSQFLPSFLSGHKLCGSGKSCGGKHGTRQSERCTRNTVLLQLCLQGREQRELTVVDSGV